LEQDEKVPTEPFLLWFLFTGLKPFYSICRSNGTFSPNKYSFVGSFRITGLKTRC